MNKYTKSKFVKICIDDDGSNQPYEDWTIRRSSALKKSGELLAWATKGSDYSKWPFGVQ